MVRQKIVYEAVDSFPNSALMDERIMKHIPLTILCTKGNCLLVITPLLRYVTCLTITSHNWLLLNLNLFLEEVHQASLVAVAT